MENTYELAFVLHPDLEINLEKPLAKIKSTIEKFGKITSKEQWDKRKLAYSIKGQQFGLYYFYQLYMPKDKLGELERELTINEEVLRHLLIKLPKVSAKKQDSDTKKAEKPKKTTTVKTKKTQAATKE